MHRTSMSSVHEEEEIKMKKIILLLCLTLVLVSCNKDVELDEAGNPIVVESIEPSERPLITVNDQVVTIGEFEKYYAMQSYDFEQEYGEDVWFIEKDGKTMTEIRQEQTIDYLVRLKLIEAYNSKSASSIDEKVIDAGYDKYMASIEKDLEIKAYYQEHGLDEAFLKKILKDQFNLKKFEELIFEDISSDEETLNRLFEDKVIRYKASHILVEDEIQLSEVLSLLNDEENPAEFSDMARLYSSHSTSAVKGGDLGYALIGTMPENFEEVALSVELYTVSEPVKTEYGYHIIFVDDRQMLRDMIELGMPEEEMNVYKTEIIKRSADEETLNVFNQLKADATIEINKALLNEE